jgi:hypothetical protein
MDAKGLRTCRVKDAEALAVRNHVQEWMLKGCALVVCKENLYCWGYIHRLERKFGVFHFEASHFR